MALSSLFGFSPTELSLPKCGICPCSQCRRQCKFFASGVNFSIFTHFLCFFLLKLLKLGEIDSVKFLAWKSGGVNFWTNSMSAAHMRTLSCSAILSHHFPPKEDWACLRQGPRPLRDVSGLHLGSEPAEVMTTVIRDRCPPKKDSSRPLKVVVSLSEFYTVCAFAFL